LKIENSELRVPILGHKKNSIDMMSIQDQEKRKQMLQVYSIMILIIMFLEIFFREFLFDLSGAFIIYLQETFPGKGFQWFFLFISGFGTPRLLVPLLLILFASEAKKFLTMKLTIYLCFVGYMVSVLKLTYKNPRPYWVWPNDPTLPNYVAPGIVPLESYAEYGNPSGHAFLVTSFYGYLYYVFLYKKAKDTPGIGHEERSLSLSHRLKPIVLKEQGSESDAQNNGSSETSKDVNLNIQISEQCIF